MIMIIMIIMIIIIIIIMFCFPKNYKIYMYYKSNIHTVILITGNPWLERKGGLLLCVQIQAICYTYMCLDSATKDQ